jgi:transposase
MNTTADSRPHAPDFAALLAFDWSDQKHDTRLLLAGQAKAEALVLDNTPEEFHVWIHKLRERVGGKPVAVGFEAHRGALLHMLLQYDFLYLYPINPKSTASFRQAFYPSGSKSDPIDVDLILSMVQKHRDRLHVLVPDTAPTRLIGALSEQRRNFVELRTSLVNTLRAALKGYFPQAIELVGENLTQPMAWDFLERWTDLESLKKAKPETIRKFYHAHQCRKDECIEERLKLIGEAKVLTTDPAICEASKLHVQALVDQLQAAQKSINHYESRLAQLMEEHADAFIFTSLPGAGSVMSARLLAAMGTDRDRWRDVEDLQVVSGVAPLIIGSGKSCQVLRRWAMPKFMHQSFVEFAKCSLPQCSWAKALYDCQREKGKNHWTALRLVAFRWMRIIFRCWKNKVAYSEETYLRALKKHGSPHLPQPV